MMRRLSRMMLVAAAFSGQALAAPRLIFDASRPTPEPSVSPAEVAALKQLYRHRQRQTCPDFKVLSRQQGPLTAHRQQTLYLVQNCYNDVAANPMRTRWQGDLLILDGQKLNYFQPAFADDVTVLPALGGRTLATLLTQTWFGPQMSEFGSVGELRQFSGDHFQPWLKLGSVYRDTGTGQSPPDKSSTATRRTLWYDPAQPSQLLVREYVSPACGCQSDVAPYDPARARKMLDLKVDLRHPPVNADWQQP